jgi:hypothetical protein
VQKDRTVTLDTGLHRVLYVSMTTGNAMDLYKSIEWELGLPTERHRLRCVGDCAVILDSQAMDSRQSVTRRRSNNVRDKSGHRSRVRIAPVAKERDLDLARRCHVAPRARSRSNVPCAVHRYGGRGFVKIRHRLRHDPSLRSHKACVQTGLKVAERVRRTHNLLYLHSHP